MLISDWSSDVCSSDLMATGASTADLAVVLVDARKGLLTQTRRHSYICALLGIRHVLLAVNKMDLVGYGETVFTGIADGYRALASELGIAQELGRASCRERVCQYV